MATKPIIKKPEPKKAEPVKEEPKKVVLCKVKMRRNVISDFGNFTFGMEYEVTEEIKKKLEGADAVC